MYCFNLLLIKNMKKILIVLLLIFLFWSNFVNADTKQETDDMFGNLWNDKRPICVETDFKDPTKMITNILDPKRFCNNNVQRQPTKEQQLKYLNEKIFDTRVFIKKYPYSWWESDQWIGKCKNIVFHEWNFFRFFIPAHSKFFFVNRLKRSFSTEWRFGYCNKALVMEVDWYFWDESISNYKQKSKPDFVFNGPLSDYNYSSLNKPEWLQYVKKWQKFYFRANYTSAIKYNNSKQGGRVANPFMVVNDTDYGSWLYVRVKKWKYTKKWWYLPYFIEYSHYSDFDWKKSPFTTAKISNSWKKLKTKKISLKKWLNLISFRWNVKLDYLKWCNIWTYKKWQFAWKKSIFWIIWQDFLINPNIAEEKIFTQDMWIFIFVTEKCELEYDYYN